MPIFFIFGKYTTESIKDVSAERTEKVVALIKKHGGDVRSMYTLMGEHDLVLIVDFPTVEEAMVASVGLHQLTGISFSTSPVVDVERFDKLIGEADKL